MEKFKNSDIEFWKSITKINRLVNKDSKKIRIRNIIDIDEIKEPKDLRILKLKKQSGYSEYRRGKPFNPKKCWGKKVKFTPMNIIKNWLFNNFSFKTNPNIKGNQKIEAEIIAKTAPIDKT